MSLIHSLSFNLRGVIISFLSFSEIKQILFVNKQLYVECLLYLKNEPFKIKQYQIFRFDKHVLFNFLKRLSNIQSLQLNCSIIDLLYIMPIFPRKLKFLKLHEIPIQQLYDQNFWEGLSEFCRELEKIVIIVAMNENPDFSPQPGLFSSFKNFIKLKKISIKVKEGISDTRISTYFMRYLFEALAKNDNQIEVLLFQNIDIYTPLKSCITKLKEIRYLKTRKPKQGFNFFYQNYLSSCPNLETLFVNVSFFQNGIIDLDAYEKDIKLKNFTFESKRRFDFNENSLLNLVSRCSCLEKFSIAGNFIFSTKIVETLLTRNLNLTELNFDYTNFDDVSCQILASSLIIGQLKKLSLAVCYSITSKGFCIVLEKCRSLLSLNVRGNYYFNCDPVDALLQSGELEELFLSDVDLDECAFSRIVKRFHTILKLLEPPSSHSSFFKQLFEEGIKLKKLKTLVFGNSEKFEWSCLRLICEIFPNVEHFNIGFSVTFDFESFEFIQKSGWKQSLKKLGFWWLNWPNLEVIHYSNAVFTMTSRICEKLLNFKKLMYIDLTPYVNLMMEKKFAQRFMVYSEKE